jgi:hypothetical protein
MTVLYVSIVPTMTMPLQWIGYTPTRDRAKVVERRREKMRFLAVLGTAGFAVIGLAIVTNQGDDHDTAPTAVGAPSSSTQAVVLSPERQGPLLGDEGMGDTVAAADLGQLASSSTIVARVRFVSREDDFWPQVDPRIWVYSRYVLEVVEVLKGDVRAGERVVVHVPGGVQAEWGNPQPGGSFEPRPGEPTQVVAYGGFPAFDPTREKVVFLQDTTIQGGTRVLWSPPEGRYTLAQGRLVSIFVDVPTDPAEIRQPDAKADVIGKTLPELAAAIG